MDEPRGRLPDFIIIGAAKSGTSALFSYLSRHPGAFGSDPKEPCFFDEDVNWHRGFDWYRGLFADARPDQLCFEGSTNYTRFPQVPSVPERIAASVPDVKLIYLMRHPIERAYSHYVHRFTKEVHPNRRIDQPFESFVKDHPMCLDSSDYALQVDRYLAHFDREQILLLRQEELNRDPNGLLDRVQRFVGLPPRALLAQGPIRENVGSGFLDVLRRRHIVNAVRSVPGVSGVLSRLPTEVKETAYRMIASSPWGTRTRKRFEPEPLRPETRRSLAERYAPSIDRVAELMGEDLTEWRT